MRYTLALMLLISALPVLSQAQASVRSGSRMSKAERQLREIEETRRQAIKQGDMKTLEGIYANDFSAIAGSGQIINKELLLAVFKRNDPSVTFTTDEINVRFFGQTAVFTGRLTGKASSGETISASRFTHIFVKRSGRWQCIAGQSTPIANRS